MSEAEDLFSFQLRAAKVQGFEREDRFAPPRKFRFDFCNVKRKLAVEIDGAIWTGGRHGRGAGITSDCEKGALALLAGFKVLRVTPDQVKSGQALRWLEALIKEV